MVSSSPTPASASSSGSDCSRVATNLYNHCREHFGIGNVVNQQDVLNTNLIPGRDLKILLDAANYLVGKHLFKLHDVRGPGKTTLGWELISPENAGKYDDLNEDEDLIYSIIEGAGAAGMWTKTIKSKSGVQSKVADKVFKALESKGLITSMKSVKNPTRKMYIKTGLTPSEEVTGGAWYTDEELDVEMIRVVADVIERYVTDRSWRKVFHDAETTSIDITPTRLPSTKRKAPEDGFDDRGKGKAKAKVIRLDDEQARAGTPETTSPRAKTKSKHAPREHSFERFAAGYKGYPTVYEIASEVDQSKILLTPMPQNAIEQLLDVMVYDDRLYKVERDPEPGEYTDANTDKVTMFRCVLNPDQVKARIDRDNKIKNPRDHESRKTALRQQELEDIGSGGITEVPCLQCPVFHLCSDEGPVSAKTCVYFDDWFTKMDQADREQDMASGVKREDEIMIKTEEIDMTI